MDTDEHGFFLERFEVFRQFLIVEEPRQPWNSLKKSFFIWVHPCSSVANLLLSAEVLLISLFIFLTLQSAWF